MKKIFELIIMCFICLANFSSCKTEAPLVSDIKNIHLAITEGNLSISPIFGESDNCSYTIIYYIDEKEIGRTRNKSYGLTYELSSEQLSIGEHHVIRIEFFGKHEGKYTDAYIERKFSIKYSIMDNSSALIGDVNEIS